MSTNTDEKPKLNRRQLKAIPFIVSNPNYTQGCEKAKINKTTLYKWLKQPEFKAELDRQRSEIVEAAFSMIAQNIEKAVTTLAGLLDSKDERIKRLTANDIIGHYLKHKELKDLEERILQIEEHLQTQVFEDKRAKVPMTRAELEEALRELDELDSEAKRIQLQVKEKCG